MLYYKVESVEPEYNLALEEQLVMEMEPGQPGWFLLWRNRPSVIVGRHQNTLEEINTDMVKEVGISVVRRGTGGGAVYHDLGNINFSFICSVSQTQDVSFGFFLRPILEALRELGLNAEFSSRNDITVDGRKVSGSAQMRRGATMLHHGTLLYDLDMSVLGQVLAGNPDKYQSKGVASHRSRVANLKELLPAELSLETMVEVVAKHCATQSAKPSPESLGRAEELARTKYRTWEWNYGKSPKFTARKRERFPWGAVECCLEVQNGHIHTCRIFGDFFSHQDISALEQALTGIPHKSSALKARLQELPVEQFFAGCIAETMLEFLAAV